MQEILNRVRPRSGTEVVPEGGLVTMESLSDWFYSMGGLQDWAVYGVAFVALGLLPVRTSLADQLISFAFALLWASTAKVANGSWALLAAAEAIIFLATGTVRGRLRFEARTGLWTAAGTSLIFYSLLLFPTLVLLRISYFDHSAFGAPFSLVLLTCGFLFFSVGLFANLLLIPPLLWAFLGGPGEFVGPVEVVGLEVTLVLGALFLSLPASLRAENSGYENPGESYRYAYQHRTVFSYLIWGLLLTTALSFYLRVGAWNGWEQVPTSLVLLAALGLTLWLAYPAWQSLWFRYTTWEVAKAGGHLRMWLRDHWRWVLLLLALLSVLGAWNPDTTTGQSSTARIEGPGEWLLELVDRSHDFIAGFLPPAGKTVWIVSTIGLLWLFMEAYLGRRRLVIGTFENKTGETSNTWAPGLDIELHSELARIAALYKVIDEALPTRRSEVVQVVPGVEDSGAILQDAITTTLGANGFGAKIAGLFTRLVRGPQLKGAVHKIGDSYIITATLSGGGLAFSWKVDAAALDDSDAETSATRDIHRALIGELAYRIATDLVIIGSPRWRAVRCFTEGLRFHREIQRQNDKNHKLREAERCFIRALKDDLRFTQCHYNLGVVYRQLGELGSAESAFRRVLKEAPDNFEACYALAETLVQSEKFSEAIRACGAAISINPDEARAWDLWGYALRQQAQEQKDVKVTLEPGDSKWKTIRERKEIAVALSWRALCREALRGPSGQLQNNTITALLCTHNLSVVLARSGRYPEGERVFHQGVRLAPKDSCLRLYQGRAFFWKKDWHRAKTTLEMVFPEGLDPTDEGLLWSTLAQSGAADGFGKDALDSVRLAHQSFLDLAASTDQDDLADLMNFGLEAPPKEQPA